MLRKILNIPLRHKSTKQKLKSRLAEYLTVNLGAVIRNTPTTKERRYRNVEITEDFKRQDASRRKQRFDNMRRRQLLLERKLQNEKLLLTASDSERLSTELAEIKTELTQAQNQIQELNKLIQQTEADFVVLESRLKNIVLTNLKYLKYMHDHNPSVDLHPETIRTMENVHYCINHNLPVKRTNLYEIMPEFFEAEIGELDQAVQRLIREKQIFIENEDETSTVRVFLASRRESSALDDIKEEVNKTWNGFIQYTNDELKLHQELIEDVKQGKTVYRNIHHLRNVLMSDLPINFLPEERALRESLLKIAKAADEWHVYRELKSQQFQKVLYAYVPPPPYIANHPVLLERYNRGMVNFSNPITIEQTGVLPTMSEDRRREVELANNMEEQLTKIAREKFDPMFVEMMNKDRSLIDKKKIEIEFYEIATNVLENLQALEDKSTEEQQLFMPTQKKEKSFLLQQRKKTLLGMDELTRILYLNNRDRHKYNVEFFARWFGVELEELRTLLKSVGYLRVPVQAKEIALEDLKFEILRMKM